MAAHPKNIVTYRGETKSLYRWCRELGLDYRRAEKRYRAGMAPERIFHPGRLDQVIIVTWNGITHTLSEWSVITGIPRPTLWQRYRRGQRDPKILFRPVGKVVYPPTNVVFYEVDKRRDTLPGHAERRGVCPHAVRSRVRRGESVESALTRPFRPRRPITTQEIRAIRERLNDPVKAIAVDLGRPYPTICNLVRRIRVGDLS